MVTTSKAALPLQCLDLVQAFVHLSVVDKLRSLRKLHFTALGTHFCASRLQNLHLKFPFGINLCVGTLVSASVAEITVFPLILSINSLLVLRLTSRGVLLASAAV